MKITGISENNPARVSLPDAIRNFHKHLPIVERYRSLYEISEGTR